MQTVILCGGRGIRLNEMTEFIPKPMVMIGREPILVHIMRLFSFYGFRDFILPIGYRGNLIREYFDRAVLRLPVNSVVCVDTGEDTETGGRLMQIADRIKGDHFFLTYGDNAADVNLAALLAFHREHGRLATVTAVNPPSRFGVLDIAAGGYVMCFEEKPKHDWVNGGFFVLRREALGTLTDDVFEYAALKAMANRGQLMAHKHTGFWHTMDTYRDYLELERIWNESGGKPPWLPRED